MADVDPSALRKFQEAHSVEAGKEIKTAEELAEAGEVLSLREKIFKKIEDEDVDYSRYPTVTEFKSEIATVTSAPAIKKLTDEDEKKDKKEDKKEEKAAQPSTQNTFGDFHAHTIKMIYVYIKTGLLELKNGKDDYNKLRAINKKFNELANETEQTAQAIKEFADILRAAKWNKEKQLRRLGDILADAGGGNNDGNDILTFVLERILREQGIIRHTLSSNHDDFLFHYYWKNRLGACGSDPMYRGFSDHHPTLQALCNFWEKQPQLQQDIRKDFEDNYVLTIKAIDYLYDVENKALVLFTHAPNGLETVAALAKHYEIAYKDQSAAELKNTIDQINQRYAYDVQSGDLVRKIDKEIVALQKLGISPGDCAIPIEFPLVRLIWNRPRGFTTSSFSDSALNTPYSLGDKTKLFFGHGHDGGGSQPYRHLRYNMINLDNRAGKGPQLVNDYYLQTTGICAPLPPDKRPQIHALKALYAIVTRPEDYYSDPFLLHLLKIKKIIAYHELTQENRDYAVQFLSFLTKLLESAPTSNDPSAEMKSYSEQLKNCKDEPLRQAIQEFTAPLQIELEFRANPQQQFEESTKKTKIDRDTVDLTRQLFAKAKETTAPSQSFLKQAFYALIELPSQLRVPASDEKGHEVEKQLAAKLTTKITYNNLERALAKPRNVIIGVNSETVYTGLLTKVLKTLEEEKAPSPSLLTEITAHLTTGAVSFLNFTKTQSPDLNEVLDAIGQENRLRNRLSELKQKISSCSTKFLPSFNQFLQALDDARLTLSTHAMNRIIIILKELNWYNDDEFPHTIDELLVTIELDNLRHELTQKKPVPPAATAGPAAHDTYQKQKKLYEAGTKVYTEGFKMADLLIDDPKKQLPALLNALTASKNVIKTQNQKNISALEVAIQNAPNESIFWTAFCGTLCMLGAAACFAAGIAGIPFSAGTSVYVGYYTGAGLGAISLGFFARAIKKYKTFSKAEEELLQAAKTLQPGSP